jgi:hypothetical protein
MRGHETEGVARLAVRARVCGVCSQRPRGSETWSAAVPRPCEDHCPVLMNLRGLLELSREGVDATPGAFEHGIEERVCSVCASAPTAGEHCAEWLARTCPLSRYGGLVIDVLERVTVHGRTTTTKAA